MASNVDQQYCQMIDKIIRHGALKKDRTGTGAYSLFGERMEFDLSQEFPLLTTKFVPFKHVFLELKWFLLGMTNVKWLQERGVTIWDEWADGNGNLGPVYGRQWRSWQDDSYGSFVDQIATLQNDLVNNPDSRRHYVSAWNVAEIPSMALPPCHLGFQCYVAYGRLSLQMYQRSADLGLGVPFNIASYATLTHLLAKTCGLEVGRLICVFGDIHIYLNHLDQLREQASRAPYDPPTFKVNRMRRNVWEYELNDIELGDYKNHGKIKMEVSK